MKATLRSLQGEIDDGDSVGQICHSRVRNAPEPGKITL